ncbi:hypothetical protein [Sphingobacterium cellulitidis]|uniref:hypothetical protein n=1 Tax=Sphingobacterium cellulitidis TaxID=1768011 RepID=UPI003C7D3364
METVSFIYFLLFVQAEQGVDQITYITSGNRDNNYFFWVSIALNIVLILMLIYLIFKTKFEIENLEKKQNKNISSVKFEYSNCKSDLMRKLREIEDLKNELTNLKSEGIKKETLEKVVEENNSIVVELSIENTNSNSYLTQNDTSFSTNPVDSSPKTFYASCELDNEIGYLIIENKRSHKTPYQIQFVDGNYFFVVDSQNRDASQNAINFYNIYINPFCIPSNTFQDYFKTFIGDQNSKGILEKEGDKFRVVEKLKIRFLEG